MADENIPQEPSKSALKKAEKQAKQAAEKAAKAAKLALLPKKQEDTSLGMTIKKADDFSGWYLEVVQKAEMIEYYREVAGLFVLRPTSMHIWDTVREWFDKRIKKMGVKPCSFPMFVTKESMAKEEGFIEGFSPGRWSPSFSTTVKLTSTQSLPG